MLHITNGESVSVRETGLTGEVIYWADVLHEGPTPSGLSLREMSEVRARFLGDAEYTTHEEAYAHLAARDSALEEFREHDEVVLWFEHDLYDQLQLIQVLDWFLTHDRSGLKLSLICIGKFPGIGRFKGLGQLSPPQLNSLFAQRVEVTLADLKLAAEAWAAFCSDNPTDIEWLIANQNPSLPYLRGALARHLEQFPSVKNGLSRTERQILEVIASGMSRFDDLFLGEQDKEERVFMGDQTLHHYIERMRRCPVPLVELNSDAYSVTPAGHNVLVGGDDAIRLNGIDRWLGGVHLNGGGVPWRWDERAKRLKKPESS